MARKTETRRDPRYQYHVGRIYPIGDSWRKPPAGHILILRKWRQRLGDMSPEEINAEGFNSLDEMRSFWEENIERWQPDRIVIAYEFRLCSSC